MGDTLSPIYYMSQQYICYLLSMNRRYSYIGVTCDIKRRLRQHNGEIKGGAKYTSSKLNEGTWTNIMYVEGFPSYQAALQFEWRWKRASKGKVDIRDRIHLRLKVLADTLDLEKVTRAAEPLSSWPLKLVWTGHSYTDICYYYSIKPVKIILRGKQTVPLTTPLDVDNKNN